MSEKLERLKKEMKALKKERAALEKKLEANKAKAVKRELPAFMAKESKY